MTSNNYPAVSCINSNNESFLTRIDRIETDDQDERVELLVNTRAKRSTAGNRLQSLLQQEEPEDELELLFAEDEDDSCFVDVEADLSDLQMDSSTDEYDGGPAAEDSLEGEKELQNTIKGARKKTKRNEKVFSKILKKARVDTSLSLPTLQTNKKLEKASFLTKMGETSIRESSRHTTRQRKQELHVQMMDREIRRLKQLANMEKNAAAKAAKEAPPLTQEDRLKEAARVEKANAKSLSHWERAEREREEKQRLRMANLHYRNLQGPVITYWSGMATYIEGKLERIGKIKILSKEKPVTMKRKLTLTDENEKRESSEETKNGSKITPNIGVIVKDANKIWANSSKFSDQKEIVSPKESEVSFLATSKDLSQTGLFLASSPPQALSSCLAPPAGLPLVAPPHPFLAPPSLNASPAFAGLGDCSPQQHSQHCLPCKQSQFDAAHQNSLALPPRTTKEHCLRSSLIFTSFSETAIKSRETQLNVLFPHFILSDSRPIKSSRSKGSRNVICAITGHPAKYRDPKTGLYYYNLYAYKEIQKLQRGEIWWSDLLGLYVGYGTLNAAKGVPDRFQNEKL
ncbi:putative yl1 nuclear protein [Golovinomyces cichoracearum]|uniref:Putative yl1 nuclear protein n=1 Tax=Golovinomyces cichoracearum TaxID=62708 RepID=A0A420J095_9PEZI|nr:putative yl1 nuclear protein [Golovinomyces cichoracearum]